MRAVRSIVLGMHEDVQTCATVLRTIFRPDDPPIKPPFTPSGPTYVRAYYRIGLTHVLCDLPGIANVHPPIRAGRTISRQSRQNVQAPVTDDPPNVRT